MGEILFENITITYNEIDNQTIQINCYPLERGYGHTLGNLITKSLIKAGKGITVCGFTAKNIGTEKESLIFALRSLKFQLAEGFSVKKLHKIPVNTKTSDMIYGRDLVMPEGLHLLNPDFPIITSEAGLECIYITSGRGFIAEEIIRESLPKSATAIDTNFCEIERAAYRVESIRHGSAIDKERLFLSVQTENGNNQNTIKIVENAVKELLFTIEPLVNLIDSLQIEVFKPKEEIFIDERLGMPVDAVLTNLSVRAKNCFETNNIITFSDLLAIGKLGLIKLKNMGAKTVSDIATQVTALGYDF